MGIPLVARQDDALFRNRHCRIRNAGKCVCLVLQRVGNRKIGFADAVLIFVNATLFGAASMIPRGLGAMEAALVIKLSGYGVENSNAVSVAIASRLATLWLGVAVGGLALFSVGRQGIAKE